LINSGIDKAAAIQQVGPLKTYEELVIGVAVTTVCWVLVTLFTKPADEKTLISFYNLVQPGKFGWSEFIDKENIKDKIKIEISQQTNLPLGILSMIVGCFTVYGLLFATGYWIYSNYLPALLLTILSIISSFVLFKLWGKVSN
jgi:CDP-diglyceride synthetase